MNYNNKIMGRINSNFFSILVLATLFITLISGYLHAGTLMPERLVIKDKFLPGKGLPIGKVLSVQESVIIIHSDDASGYKADKELPVFERDTVITQKKGRIEILLNDESKLILASGTKLELTKSVYDPKMKTRFFLINMAIGKARYLVTKLSNFNSSEFKVKTNTAVAGVRGSDFVVTAKPGVTEISALAKTSLEVTNILWPDKITVLSDYEKTIVRQDSLPSTVEKISADEINKIQNELGGSIGSDISQGSVIINKFSGNNLTNVAIGKGSEANLGTIKIKGSKIQGVIVNEGSASNVTNVAIGN
ncbi:MAG: FecR domain-containing protein, partial [Proteobacteria bacterium]|nr:FecR domain-containing protein [Pseudomonadota bacterium]MBU1571351.1 FecR domain-containing protein [Pseudomonadota bacterium]